jgi:hypothetical protein
VLEKILEARTEAVSGRLIGAPPVGAVAGEFSGWAAQANAASAGFRVNSVTAFDIFIDEDNVAGGEQSIRSTDFAVQDFGTEVVFDTSSVGRIIRFRKDGTALNTETFTLQDVDLGMARDISVTKVGQVRIVPRTL